MAKQTLVDKINAVNVYADYLDTLHAQGKQFNPLGITAQAKAEKALRHAAMTVLDEAQDWPEIDKRDGQHIVLRAPDGSRVLYAATGAERLELLNDDTTAEDAPKPLATAYRDPSYHQGLHDGLESDDAILHAIEQLTGVDLLAGTGGHLVRNEPYPNAAQALWQDDPDGRVAAYLLAQFSAQEGDTLHWGAGSLTYSSGTWS